MRWILTAMVVLTVMLCGFVLVGGLLSPAHEVTRSALVAAPPERVFALVTDIAAMDTWRPHVVRVDPVAGEPSVLVSGAGGPVTFTVEEARAPSFVRLGVRGAGPNIQGTWSITLAAADAGTRVSMTERASIENPVFRFLSRFVVGHATAVDAYLGDLVAHLGGRAGASTGE
ncbi:SRPBCC family protein [Haliangium ochraceum]|uniref:Polyketide cyclase/dehydrase n=1 Tax=Haliangium ochraceum (strain DSM 14365 / JCM 11303 / SMP-2) TaxID=502025 RepID=D0LX87_HALO1|nr:SRPBCC family protein [Haliangium ochraceum]ACY16129.1 Polyketide cyclase/dehydrase [Haliangium ochraceum DSM 14365]